MTSLMTLNQHIIENYVIIPSLKSETVGKLINRISGSSLPCSSLLLYKRNHGRVRNMGCPITGSSNLCVSILREYIENSL